MEQFTNTKIDLENKPRLKNKIINLFGLPDFGFALFIYVELYYFTAFLTDYAKFSLSTVAAILSATAIIDLVWVPLTGIIIEKSNFKWGKFRSWFIVGPPFVVVCFALMFTRIGSESIAALIVVAAFAIKTLAQNIVYSAHVSQMSEISSDPEERTLLSARKIQYNTAGIIVFSACGLPVITYLGNLVSDSSAGYTLGALLFALLYGLSCYLLFKITAEVTEINRIKENKELKTKLTIAQMLKAVFKNPPLLIVLLADSARQVARFLIIGSAFYYFKVVLDNMVLFTTYLLCINFAGFAGSFITNTVSKTFGKKKAYIIFMLGCLTCLIGAYLFGSNGIVFIGLLTITMMLISPATALIVSMIADCVVYDEHKNGVPARGFIMSMVNVPIKSGAMLRSVILPAGLVAAGYAADKVADVQMINGVSKLMTLYPSIFIAVAIVIIAIGYRLTEDKVLEMTGEINKR